MSKLVDLDEFRLKQTARRGFSGWQKRFEESFSFKTRISDLSNTIICIMAEPGEESASVFYELIMGVLDLGNLLKFEFLKPVKRLRVVDTHLLLADLVRYDMMKRIGWIDDYPNREKSLIELVETYDQSDYSRYSNPPQLLENHPQFESFEKQITREKEVMLRQLHSEALDVFKQQIKP